MTYPTAQCYAVWIVQVIGALISQNTVTTALDLSLNMIAGPNGDEMQGLRTLGDALRQNSRLEMLDLQDCNLGEACAELLAEACVFSNSLMLVRLDESEIPIKVR